MKIFSKLLGKKSLNNEKQNIEDNVMEVEYMSEEHTPALIDDDTASIVDKTMGNNRFNQVVETVNTAISIADRALEVWQESNRIEQNIAMIEAAKEVELQNIVAKFELCKEMLTQTFGQRQQGLNAHYQMLDKALGTNDREMIIASLKGISSIVASNPLEDFSKFIEAWNDKSKPLELDF